MRDPAFPPDANRVAAMAAIDGLHALCMQLFKSEKLGGGDIAAIGARMRNTIATIGSEIDPASAEALDGYVALHFNHGGAAS